jgi:glycosyltransferase involved in cell wall biosynthesis
MIKNLRILLLFPHYGSIERAASLRSSQIGFFLVKKGYEVNVFAPGVDLRTEKSLPEVKGKLVSDKMINGVRVIRPKCLENFRKSFFHRLIFECLFALSVIALFVKIKRPDIVIGAYPPAVLPGVGLLICKLLRIPYIFEIRDLMADALVATNYSKSSLFNKLAQWVEIQICKRSDHLVTVSNGIKKIIISKGFDPKKITPVINGYEPQVFQNADYSLTPRVKFAWDDRFVVIYAGGLTQSYDIQTLLKAAALTNAIEDVLYVIIGEGEKKKQYINYCAKNSLDNVQILDSLPRKYMPSLLSSANVGVHLFPDNPLWAYVLGNKPFDYLGSGIPMIYCGTGDTADLIKAANAGFVIQPEQPHKLVEKILYLKNNPDEAAKMGKRGQEYVKTHYNRFELLQKLDEVIQNTVKSNRSAKTNKC